MSIDNDLELISSFEKEYCINVFAPLQVAFSHGKGVYLYGVDGKKYMDMIGGIAVNSLGHGNRALTKAISTQAKKLIHCCNYYLIPQRAELAYKLCSKTFADKCFFSNSGAEANEAAIKIARGYFYHKGIDKNEIITAKMSFHGRTLLTCCATGQEKFRRPFAPYCPGFSYAEFNNFEDLESLITDKTAAIMLELIQGESGVNPASLEYIKNVRKLCTDRGVLLIIDEVQTGIGRTGKLFCYENYGIKPDILTTAKGLGGGVPIGAMLCTDEVAKGFLPGDHGSTFGGNPLCCAAANAVLDEISNKFILDNVIEVSEALIAQLKNLKSKYSAITSVRGMGLLIGIDFSDNFTAVGLKQRFLSEGFLVSSIGEHTIRIAPPLIISKKEAMIFCNALEKILKSDKKTSGFKKAGQAIPVEINKKNNTAEAKEDTKNELNNDSNELEE